MKPKKTSNPYAERKKREQERLVKERKNRIIFFSIIGVVLVAFIAALIFRPDPSAKAAEFDYSSMPVLGDPNAPVKIVEYGDYQCPACRNFSLNIKPDLVKKDIESGKAAIYFQDLIVLDGNGIDDSNRMALAAHSIYHQDKESFWKFNDAIYREQGQEKTGWATTDFIVNLAKSEQLPIDYDKLKSDIENKTYQNEVDASIAQADKLRVQSTPSFFINGKLYNGNYSYNDIHQAIETASKGE